MNKICIEGMTFFAHHGYHQEENTIGGQFMVDIEFETIFSTDVEKHDDIDGTVNYEKVYEIIKKEMFITSKLLEHLGFRIIDKLYDELRSISFIRLKVSKLNPPLGGEVEKVSVILEK